MVAFHLGWHIASLNKDGLDSEDPVARDRMCLGFEMPDLDLVYKRWILVADALELGKSITGEDIVGEGEGIWSTIGTGEGETIGDAYAEVNMRGDTKERDREGEGGTWGSGEDRPGKGVMIGKVHWLDKLTAREDNDSAA